VNPLEDYAVDEIARCARNPNLRHGLKLHLGNSDVQLEKPEHAAQVRRVFQAANQHGMAIVVHMRASISLKRPYAVAPNDPPKEAWAVFRRLPFTEKEFAVIAGNVPPYLR